MGAISPERHNNALSIITYICQGVNNFSCFFRYKCYTILECLGACSFRLLRPHYVLTESFLPGFAEDFFVSCTRQKPAAKSRCRKDFESTSLQFEVYIMLNTVLNILLVILIIAAIVLAILYFLEISSRSAS